MFVRTNIPEAPWYVVEANDKRRARLNCIDHLLGLIPYQEVPRENGDATVSECQTPNYERSALPRELYVPEKILSGPSSGKLKLWRIDAHQLSSVHRRA